MYYYSDMGTVLKQRSARREWGQPLKVIDISALAVARRVAE